MDDGYIAEFALYHSPMKNLPWDTYQLFIDVARNGGLTGAVQSTGLSAATLGRRMVELEQKLGRILFHRAQTGYTLTVDGRALLDHLKSFEAAERGIDLWRQQTSQPALVRVTAGTWISWLIAQNLPKLCRSNDRFRLDLHITEERAALAHRETDIGIRAFEPQESNLARVPLGEVAYAAYRHRLADELEGQPWIAVAQEAAISAYLKWPHQHKAEQILITVNRPRSLKDMAVSGMGLAVLPCFVGDSHPQLQRVGDEITELRHRQWLVTNNDDRHRSEIRDCAGRLVTLMRDFSDAFAGRR